MVQKLKISIFSGFIVAILFCLFSIIIQTKVQISSLIFKSLIAGILTGFTVNFSILKIVKNGVSSFASPKFTFDKDEEIIHESGATYLEFDKRIDGKLYYTPKRTVFISSQFKDDNYELILLNTNIKKVSSFNPMGNATKGLEFISEEKPRKFIVENADLWLSIIGKI